MLTLPFSFINNMATSPHRMIHKEQPWLSVEELRRLIRL